MTRPRPHASLAELVRLYVIERRGINEVARLTNYPQGGPGVLRALRAAGIPRRGMGESQRATPESFWRQLDRSGECWVWPGHHDAAGYGFITYQGRSWRTNRLAYTLARGPIPAGLDILHTCDNPPCCNPAHLKPGTDLDNAADRIAKGRHRRGQRSPSDSELLFIRQTYALGVSQSALARETGLSQAFISDVVRNRTRTRPVVAL